MVEDVDGNVTVGSLGDVRGENAGGLVGEEDVGVSGEVDILGGVVSGVEDGVEVSGFEEVGAWSGTVSMRCWCMKVGRKWARHTGLQAHAAAQVLDGLLTTGDVALLLTASTQLCGALVQAARAERSVLQESGTLGGLGLDVVTWVGRDDAGKASQASDEGGSELNHD